MVNVHYAKTHLSRLLALVETGEEVIIARDGQPIARLVPFQAPRVARVPGTWAGEIWMADDFNESLPDEWMEELEP